GSSGSHDYIGLEPDQLFRQQRHAGCIAISVAIFEHVIAAFHIAEFSHPQWKAAVVPRARRLRACEEKADERSLRRRLGQSVARPRRWRAAEQRDELAARSHSITSSASVSRLSGMVSPSALAVLMLMTKLNLVGCSTGKSLGFSPLRMRPT